MTFAIVVGSMVVSIVGGWYVTRGILALAARNTAREVTGPVPPGSADAAESSAPDGVPGASESGAGENGAGAGEPVPDVGPTSPQAVAALRGGTWIGILERLAITGLILVGYPTGIAILVAIKGLGRYPELRDNPAASERFVIGTLASMVWAGGLGVLGAWLIHR
ncbi:hypothetical protein [Sanguibacter gelidistatuariae]|uniref:hypothetical protein n=1 Tax=Sanguibacter gelidistatuariae TaxID=1814289 RepID=UPI001FE12076|nr:hypothetical protein [Sanguibacter gelidistatuariae]